jgi:nucleotide-binding universal stress UspA family protein
MLRVLVPSDGSPNSQYGVRHVVSEFMKNRDLEIHILNVQRPFSKHIGRFVSQRNRIEFHQAQAETALKPVRQALDSSGIPYTVHTETGDKAGCIADAAQRLQCDRIVMGTARKSSLIRWLEDSVTNKVVERTTVPVEVIAGNAASGLERVGIPAGIGTGLALLWIAAVD